MGTSLIQASLLIQIFAFICISSIIDQKMAAHIATPKASSHTRSISMPSRSHPLTLNVEEHLYRLKSYSQASSSICYKLSGLKDLYECVDDMLQMSLVQQVLCHEQSNKWAEDVMDGSFRVLDACGITRDAFSQMKACVQDLQSALRRKRGEELGLANEVKKYMVSRKKVNKLVSKSFGNLKRSEKKHSSFLLNRDSDLVAIASILREVEEISLSVFETLLTFISKPNGARSKMSNWSLVSKLMKSKRVSCERDVENSFNELESMNDALSYLSNQKTGKCINVEQVQNLLKPLEAFSSSTQELEDELECVFRRIIKTRVSLLNSLSP